MKFLITTKNYQNLTSVARVLKKNKVRSAIIRIHNGSGLMPKFSDISQNINSIVNYRNYFAIWLENFPFCAVSGFALDHVTRTGRYHGQKIKKCQKCKFKQDCPGFPKGYFKKYGNRELQPFPDIPNEIKIEVESRCNFNCAFCFNRESFAKKNRAIGNISSAFVRKIIDGAAKVGVKTIRFTGGEPLLRYDIFELFKYAKEKKMNVQLNTNGSLVNAKLAKKMKGLVDSVLISFESHDPRQEEKITGHRGALKKRIKAIMLLKKNGIPNVRVSSVIMKENMLAFDKMAKLILSLPIDEWEWYRPISSGKTLQKISKNTIDILVKKIMETRRKTGRSIVIGNALPFCASYNPDYSNSISIGARFNLVVDPRGFAKPEYYIEKNVGDPSDIMSAWNNPFMRKLRNLRSLPLKCQKCRFRLKCKGGSRHEAKLASGSYKSLDPLAITKHGIKK